MINIEIKNRWTGSIIFEYSKENNTIKDTLIEAVKNKKDLHGADLRGADLQGADLHGVKIKKAVVFTGLYKYICIPFISEENEIYIKMGCYTRLLSEWENDFWNNPSEFPNDGNIESKYRLMAFEFCKQWIELNS